MKKSKIIASIALLFAAILGLSIIGFCADECKCFKMTYMMADGQNMTIDFYNPSCEGMCNEDNTEMLYLDSEGRCDINGEKSPFCQCGPNCPVGCTCLQNLTLDSIAAALQSMM